MDEGDGAKRTGGSFLDSLGRLFGGKTEPAAAPAAAPPASGFEALEAAVRALNERIEQQRGPAAATGTAAGSGPSTPAERKADRERHIESVRREMREDIERMHTRLGTGLTATDLDAIAALLEELEAMAVEGRGSAALLPRARAAIVERLRSEAGELAVARVAALLREQGMEWPDPSRPPPSATHEEIARARRRRLEDVRRAFLG